jgi:ABC-2 type transport system ATP-binding protein
VNDVIVAEGITKAFGRARALDGVNLRVPEGSIFGFLGPNGSGKTTTLRVLLGLVLADEEKKKEKEKKKKEEKRS